ncbi:MAG TPA: AraC family transcriptional regulator [Lachnospiraceae bacterium]|nr:AraC family transcriptional regulator [Lachnospiraceae bacterium]
MTFNDYFHVELNTALTGRELIFKEIFHKHPDRSLDCPHNLDETRDILEEAQESGLDSFAELLFYTHLSESSFFQNGSDTELYQHCRYLPAICHSHDFFEIVCVVNGCCTNYIKNQSLSMKKGDICIIAPEVSHAISAFSDECFICNILLRTSTFEKAFFGTLEENDILSDFFARSLYHSPSHPYLCFQTGYDTEVFNYIGYAYHEFNRNRQYKNRMLNSIINALFITLLRNHGNNVIMPETGSTKKSENLVFMLKYIQEHFNTVSLAELSGFFNYSERQIQRIIKDSTGLGFSENILRLKMKKAGKLLKNPDLTIATVAEKTGYSDPGTFRQAFKKYYGMTPKEYRQ